MIESVDTLLSRLQEGRRVRDVEFDALFSNKAKALSAIHWTPVEVAQKAARFFSSKKATKILDVGSGVGKFCVVAAATCPDLEFTGVEQRRTLVAMSRFVAKALGLQNVTFVQRDATKIDWEPFDGFYFYNPFYEHVAHEDYRIDHDVKTSQKSFDQYLTTTQERLTQMPKGTLVVTYNGIGGPMPSSFRCLHSEKIKHSVLSFWKKTSL